MEGRILTADIIDGFRKNLELQEKSTATIEKYIRDVKAFSVYAQDEVITKVIVITCISFRDRNAVFLGGLYRKILIHSYGFAYICFCI